MEEDILYGRISKIILINDYPERQGHQLTYVFTYFLVTITIVIIVCLLEVNLMEFSVPKQNPLTMYIHIFKYLQMYTNYDVSFTGKYSSYSYRLPIILYRYENVYIFIHSTITPAVSIWISHVLCIIVFATVCWQTCSKY